MNRPIIEDLDDNDTPSSQTQNNNSSSYSSTSGSSSNNNNSDSSRQTRNENRHTANRNTALLDRLLQIFNGLTLFFAIAFVLTGSYSAWSYAHFSAALLTLIFQFGNAGVHPTLLA